VKIPIQRLLDSLSIRAKRRGRLWVASCPNPEHADRTPSWSIIDDDSDRHGSHWCHACGMGGGPWELVAAVRGLSLEDAGRWCFDNVIRGMSGIDDVDIPRIRIVAPAPTRRRVDGMEIPSGVQIPSADGTEWHPRALSYLEGRGVPEWQRRRWHIGFSTSGRCAWRVFVPVFTGGRLLSYVARAFIDDGRPRYDAGRRDDPGCRPDVALWGEPGFDQEVRVATVTEGVFKGLAMERAGAPNPCAILGANNLGTEKIERLKRFAVLLIATDPDRAGDTCAEKISDLTSRYCEPVRVKLEVSPDDATFEQNDRAWREALTRALPALRSRLRSRAIAGA